LKAHGDEILLELLPLKELVMNGIICFYLPLHEPIEYFANGYGKKPAREINAYVARLD
jgi:hypothetical protein